MNSEYIRKGRPRLRGKTIFLSAAWPDESFEPEISNENNYSHEVDMALISAAKAVYANSGGIITRYRPETAILLGMVAAEYAPVVKAEETDSREESLHIFHAPRIYFDQYHEIPDEVKIMQRAGYLDIMTSGGDDQNTIFQLLENTRPSAMLCIGGDKTMWEEVNAFLEISPEGKIFVMETTGGNARHIAEEYRHRTDPFDAKIMGNLKESLTKWAKKQQQRREKLPKDFDWERPFRFTPYSLIMQEMVEELVEKPRFFEA